MRHGEGVSNASMYAGKPPNDTKNTFILIVENVELIDLKSYIFYFS